MLLTPSTVRFDLKCGQGTKACGKACIPVKNQCKKGVGRKIAAATALVGFAGQAATGGAALGSLLGGDTQKANRLLQANAGFQALTATGARGLGLKQEANKMITQAALTGASATALAGDFNRLGRASAGRLSALKGQITQRGTRARLERQFKKRSDSIWASGFSPEPETYDV